MLLLAAEKVKYSRKLFLPMQKEVVKNEPVQPFLAVKLGTCALNNGQKNGMRLILQEGLFVC